MENLAFDNHNRSFKEIKLKKVILSKIADVSDENIQNIVESIDIDKQYYVKAVRNANKFMNIVTDENVCIQDNYMISKNQIIYGNCMPGLFVNHFGVRSIKDGFIDSTRPAAAIKCIKEFNETQLKQTKQILVIYEPKRTI